MIQLVEQSKARCRDDEQLLTTSRQLIALSRRRLNPAWAISGASDVDLRLSIRDRLERGALSLGSRSVAARWGDGRVCVVCDRMIASTEIANGSLSDDGETVWTHLGCLRLWREEARSYEVNQIERERAARAELCATVRDGFADLSIPVLPHQRSRLGRGVSGPCSMCRHSISRSEMVYEVVGGVLGRAAVAHPVCYRVWRIESKAHRLSRG